MQDVLRARALQLRMLLDSQSTFTRLRYTCNTRWLLTARHHSHHACCSRLALTLHACYSPCSIQACTCPSLCRCRRLLLSASALALTAAISFCNDRVDLSMTRSACADLSQSSQFRSACQCTSLVSQEMLFATMLVTCRVRSLLEVLPVSIPALRQPAAEAASPGLLFRQHSGPANQQAPYVTIRGLRLPDALNPNIDNDAEAQVCAHHVVHQC